MDNKVEQLYRLLLKEQWRVKRIDREQRHNLTIIRIHLEATLPVITDDFLGAMTNYHATFTTYRL